MRVKLISATQNPIDIMWTAARTCYSEKSPIEMWEEINKDNMKFNVLEMEKHWNLVKKVLDSGHQSIAEHVYFTFAIEGVDRALTHQLVRHRIAVFCVSGDTRITTSSRRTNKKTIRELYNLLPQYKKNIKVRCANETSKEFMFKPIKNILYNGKNPVYEVKTEDGYCIKTTLNHKFLSANGWKTLAELSVGNEVYTNGSLAYRDKEWLQEHYIQNNESQEYMGLLCGVSKHTIRKYICLHGLQKELGSWSVGVEPPNKGKTKFNYEPLKAVSEKMIGNHNAPHWKGSCHPSYKGEDITNSGGYTRTHRNYKKRGICEKCGKLGYTEFHHIDRNPKNTSSSNIIELCFNCHRQRHSQRLFVAKLSKIRSIEYVGVEDTYDVEMQQEPHNFVANGFVVHNSQQSQRYVEIKESLQELRDIKEHDGVAKTAGIVEKYFVPNQDGMSGLKYAELDCLIEYRRLIEEESMAPEDARAILPNATKTNLVMSCDLRELIHMSNLRLCTRAQAEIRSLFQAIKKEVENKDERISELLVPSCEAAGFCSEHNCCGRKPTKKEVLEGYFKYKDLEK